MSDALTVPPEAYTRAGWMTVASGVLNILAATMWLAASVFSIYGLCCCFVPLGAMVAGGVETWVGVRMAQGHYVPRARERAIVRAVAGVVMCIGVLSLAFDAYVIASLGRPEVLAWLDEHRTDPD